MRRTVPQHAALVLFLGATTASQAGAAPASPSASLWVADPVALSSDIDAIELKADVADFRSPEAELGRLGREARTETDV